MHTQHRTSDPSARPGALANLSIRKKLLLNAAIPLLLLGAFAVWLWFGLTGMQHRVSDQVTAKVHFALLAKIAARNGLDRLSMGMSGDFETAIAHGATSVRVGSALFGARA